MKHKLGKAGAGAPSGSGGGGRRERESAKGSIDREGQIKLGILIRRMYEADLQKPAPDSITDLVKQFDKTRELADANEVEPDEEPRS
jgi:hypothetical protein